MAELSKTVGERDPEVLIIDARPPSAFAAGHIPGARNIRLNNIDAKERDPALERYKAIIVYGETPGPTIERATAKRLIEARYDDVRWFEDGFQAWVRGGMPVARSEAARPKPESESTPSARE